MADYEKVGLLVIREKDKAVLLCRKHGLRALILPGGCMEPGERFAISESDDGIVITRVPANPADFLCGIFKTEPSMTHDLILDRKED